MASTISNAALTVTITEILNMNGSNHGSTKQMTISGVNEVSKRIMTCAIDPGTQIYAGSTEASYGTFVTANVKYLRITNLDDTNFVVLHFSDGTENYAQFTLAAGHVFILTDVSSAFDTGESSVGSFTAADITRIDAMADTAAADIEIMVASA
tara:strand:- start:2830 stop:3288 length:459 start_codon:yes stop_codon:yes gene_type:complete